MTTQSPAKIIRALMIVTGKGTVMYNDKTSFGRSIKVQGVDDKWHHEAANILKQHGYNTKIVTTPILKETWRNGGETRIWVYK